MQHFLSQLAVPPFFLSLPEPSSALPIALLLLLPCSLAINFVLLLAFPTTEGMPASISLTFAGLLSLGLWQTFILFYNLLSVGVLD